MTPLSKWEKTLRKYFRRGPKYTTNFIKTKQGNGLLYGQELHIRISEADVVTAKLYDPLNKRVYSIDQSHANDEDKDVETIHFTMKSRMHPSAAKEIDNYQLPGGDYALLVWWWDNYTMRGGMYHDKFVVENKPIDQ